MRGEFVRLRRFVLLSSLLPSTSLARSLLGQPHLDSVTSRTTIIPPFSTSLIAAGPASSFPRFPPSRHLLPTQHTLALVSRVLTTSLAGFHLNNSVVSLHSLLLARVSFVCSISFPLPTPSTLLYTSLPVHSHPTNLHSPYMAPVSSRSCIAPLIALHDSCPGSFPLRLFPGRFTTLSLFLHLFASNHTSIRGQEDKEVSHFSSFALC